MREVRVMGARKKLTGLALIRLHDDLKERRRLRQVLSENSVEVLSLELDIGTTTIARMERCKFDADRFPQIDLTVLAEVKRRRTLYWLASEQYYPRYKDAALMARYDISKPTLTRRAKEWRAAQMESRRMAA